MFPDVTDEPSKMKPQQGQRQLSCDKWSSSHSAYVSDNLCSSLSYYYTNHDIFKTRS